jgi:hypothetical protein
LAASVAQWRIARLAHGVAAAGGGVVVAAWRHRRKWRHHGGGGGGVAYRHGAGESESWRRLRENIKLAATHRRSGVAKLAQAQQYGVICWHA